MTQMIAGGVKLGGNPDYAKALAMAALAPEMAMFVEENKMLLDENQRLKTQLEAERKRRYRDYANRLARYKVQPPKTPWYDYAFGIVFASIYLAITGCARLIRSALTSFVHLLVEKEEDEW